MSTPAPPAADDPRVIAALDAYVAALEAGRKPNRSAFLAAHSDVAGPLADCLDGLDLVHGAAARLDPPAPDPDLADATPLGDFRLLRVIGRGGMGIVYEAEQLSLGRRVALKVLPFAAALDARQLQRFKNEAQAAAHLHHPHIVPVYFVGQERGVHFYAMQLIDGRTMAGLVEDLRGPPAATTGDAAPTADTRPQAALTTEQGRREPQFFQRAARLGRQAARALEHAHQVGVIHRDVKPANLLIDATDHLWVTDFGLAQFQGHAGLTLTGDVLGTLRYMSPEQAAGSPTGIDHRTDIYSLGATLYELLTLRPVVAGSDRAFLVRQILNVEPVSPRRRRPDSPRDLETIVLKALAKSPADRYPTAQAMADDLERFLNDRPVAATRPGVWRRLRKWARRHRPAVATAAVAGVLLLVTAVVVLSVSMARIKEEEKRKDKALELAEAQKRRAEENFERAFRILNPLLHVGGVRRQVDEEPESPDAAAVRREMLEQALWAYREFLAEPTDDPASRYEASIVLLGIARLHEQLGHRPEAFDAGRRAQALAEGLVAEFPDAPKYARQRSEIDLLLVILHLRAKSDLAEAERLLRRAIGFWQTALVNAPSTRLVVRRVALDLKKLELAPDLVTCHASLGSIHHSLAEVARHGPLPDYLEQRRLAAFHVRQAADLDPTNPNALSSDVQETHGLGYALFEAGRRADGLAHLREAVTRADRLAAGWPTVAGYRRQQAYVLNSLGVCSRMVRDAEMAEAAHARALDVLDAFAAEFPTHDVRGERGRALYHRALALWQLKRPDEAVAAMRLVVSLVEAGPPIRRTSSNIADSFGARYHLGLWLDQMGKSPEAEAEYRAAAQAHGKAPEAVRSDPQVEINRVMTVCGFARLLAKTERWTEAQSLLDDLRAWTPSHPQSCNNLAWRLATDPDPRFRDPKRAVELAENAVARSPANGTFWKTLGVARYRHGDWPGAIAALEKSRQLQPQADDSANTFFLAMAHWHRGDRDQARRWYDLAVVWMAKNALDAELVRFRAEAKALLEPKD